MEFSFLGAFFKDVEIKETCMDLEVVGGGGQEVWTTPGKIKFIKFTESNSQI